MSQQSAHGVANVAQVAEFDEIIDVRSPTEFAEDHIPGAINRPVLSDEERARIGTLYTQVSPFDARKLGAVLVARNIAAHIERDLLGRPRHWRPLLYCWRGGQRSGAFSLVLRQIGWDAQRLEGGYKAWRRHLVGELALLPGRFRFVVVCGATGSGKSRVLEVLRSGGAQVLHLEDLAAHKGSVLGSLPDIEQPTQKAFETRLYSALREFDATRPVFVEAESRRIGRLQLPDALLESIRAGRCFRVDATFAARVDFLLHDYAYVLDDRPWLLDRLARLQGMQSNETLERWRHMVDAGDWRSLVEELLARHYDPLYQRSQAQNFAGYRAPAIAFASEDLGPEGIATLATAMRAASAPAPVG